MDFEQDKEKEEIKKKSKKLMIILTIILVLLFIATIAIVYLISYLQSREFKVTVDQQTVKFSEDTFIIEEDNVYVSIKDFAEKIGYVYNNGEYKHQFTEDTTKCYITNGSEAASYSLSSNTLYKLLLSSVGKGAEVDYEYYDIDEPVRLINDKLYTTLNGISIGCNVSIRYSSESNSITVYTMEYLDNFYSTKITESAITEKDNNYSNKKAILYGMIVVKNESGQYGVNDVNNQMIIGEKYSSITFLESSQEYIVTTSNSKVGIISSDGTTLIEPEYDSIKQIDKDEGLYLVSSNKKYGVVKRNGRIVIYIEYDDIGVKATDFLNDEIDNEYLLYGEFIPVKRNNKYGILDKNGNTIIPVEYDNLGCRVKDSSKNSLLLVPEYKAFVVCKDNLYGLYNSSGKELIPVLTTDMYSITTSGERNYYLTYTGQTMDIINYLQNTLGIKPVSEDNNLQINY
jgi:hypothetical protein